ncbi:hypothetical protein PIB30_021602 [Stylosanthes scabra]|uniref:Uncharacterized protein n=1 Tax=Stylosanthes scabra TaxID=79078 RepID=A0ABU6V734_9FABA|nr:hypothetical protein [Stylosanthes scabra]
MGSGVISYENEKREKFEDFDMRADAELGTFKIRCYHFDAEAFVHLLHRVRVDYDSSARDSVRGVESAKELETRSAILRLDERRTRQKENWRDGTPNREEGC